MRDEEIRKGITPEGAPNEDEEREAAINSPGKDMDAIEASAAELMQLALNVTTPFFRARVLKLASEAYELVNLGAAAFYDDDDHVCGEDCEDDE